MCRPTVGTHQQPHLPTAAFANSRVNLSKVGWCRIAASPQSETARQLTDSPLLKLTLTLLLQVQGAALPKTQKKQQA